MEVEYLNGRKLLVIPQFLTVEECHAFIKRSEQLGYADAPSTPRLDRCCARTSATTVLRNAIRADRVLLSRNYRDFENLHLLVLEAQGRHRGILVERFDDDPKHNMTPKEIVRDIDNIETSGISLLNEYQILNQWQ